MSLQGCIATSGATKSARNMKADNPLIDEHFDGAMSQIKHFAQKNASYPEQLHWTEWVRNNDGTYSKMFHLTLSNGAECSVVSLKKISDREYFKRKLKDG